MIRKTFHLMMCIIFLISILAACAIPTEVVTIPASVDSQASAIKNQLQTEDAITNDLARTNTPAGLAVAGSAPPINRDEPSLTTPNDLDVNQLHLYFVENNGQTNPDVAYFVLGGSSQVYFTQDGVTFALNESDINGTEELEASLLPEETHPMGYELSPGRYSPAYTSPIPNRTLEQVQRWAVKLDFVDANPVTPIGAGETKAIVSYFKGRPDQWNAGLRTYAQVVYGDLWPGIDLVYYGQAGLLRYNFVIHPGADPAQIQLRYRGVDAIHVNAVGQMVVSTPLGGFVDEAPIAWQTTDVERTLVTAKYALNKETSTQLDQRASVRHEQEGTSEILTFGFTVGEYDRTHALVIDPAVLIYCGYIGGTGYDAGWGIAMDGEGNAYITGETNSTGSSFPIAVGPDLTSNGVLDIFVAKVSASGEELLYAGFLGGLADDYGRDIAVDSEGNAYITGWTYSSHASFPVFVGPDLTFNGTTDAFIAKVNPSGESLVYSGYIGGSVWDSGFGVAVDGSGNSYVTGKAGSDQSSFPVLVGPDLTFNGVEDAFVAKVSTTGEELVYAGYIGGANWDWGFDIAVDGAGNAYITGETNSPEASFPISVGPDLTYNEGYRDAFVAKVNTSGISLDYAGYIGGSGGDYARGIAVDGTGNAYISGETESDHDTFPVTIGPDLTFNGGSSDAFIAKVNATGLELDYAGYIGGAGVDGCYGIAVDGAGNSYITGNSSSDHNSFPVIDGPDQIYNGGERDAFVAKVNDTGTMLVYAGYLGGLGTDWGANIAVDDTGNAFVIGTTNSNQPSFPATVGPDLTYNGGEWDAFVAKIVPWVTFLPVMIRDG